MARQERLDAESENFQHSGKEMGTTFDRSDGNYDEPSSKEVQFLSLGLVEEEEAVCTIIAPIWIGQIWFHKLLKMSIDLPS